MNVTSKLDLDGLLHDWPAPLNGDDAAWGARADQIIEAAMNRRSEDTAALAALLDAPALEPEPGEGTQGIQPRAALSGSGDQTNMSQDADQGGASKSDAGTPSDRASRAPERKRQSLKEIAARASQSGAAPPSRTSAISTPLPSSVATPLPPRAGSMPPGRPSEAGKEDSGIIDLNVVNASATAEQKAAAAKAQPGTADLLDDAGADVPPASAEAQTLRRGAVVPLAAKKKGSGGVVAGVIIAVVGLAASFAIVQMRKGSDVSSGPVAAEAPAAQPEVAKAPATVAAVAGEPTAAPDAPQEPAPEADDGKVALGPTGAGAAAPTATSAPAEADAPKAATTGKLPAAAPPPGKPGDLSTAMQTAVGAEKNSVETETPEPAAGQTRNQNVPEQPSQGSVQAAVGSVMGGAKACVAGADDVSRAQVTFSSAGSVSNVSVSGWAASNGASGCIKSALKGANVGPFSKSSFTVGVTIRP